MKPPTSDLDPFEPLQSASAAAEGSSDVTQYLRLLRDRWLLVAIALVIGVSVGVVHYFVSPKQYRADTTLHIGQRSLVPVGGEPSPWIQAWANRTYLPTQYRLLESRGLAERVVRDLRLDDDPAFVGGRRSGDGDDARTAEDDQLHRAQLANRLLGGLDVDPIQGTELLRLSYVAGSPELAARVVNGFAEAFISWSSESLASSVGEAARLIEAQIEDVKDQLQEKEAQLQQYSRDTDIIALDPEANATLQRLSRLTREYGEASSAALNREQRYRELESTPDDVLAAGTGANPTTASLRQELLRLEADYETRLKTYKPDWPEMVELAAGIEEKRQRLNAEIATAAREVRQAAYAEWQAALGLVRRLEQQQEQVKSDTLDQNLEAVEYYNLQQEIATRREMLSDLMSRLSQTGLSADLEGTGGPTNVRVVDRALVPGGPFRPSLRRNVTLGFGLGLVLGVGIVLGLHFLDRTIRTAEDLQQHLGQPVLAVIPDISSGVGRARYYGYGRRGRADAAPTREASLDIELVPESRPRLAVSEAYRSLRTALLLSSAEKLEVLTITSAEAGEGKTTTAVNLGVVMAQLGRRVLLVDADLRKPRLHRVFKASNEVGLVSYLTGSAEALTAVQDTHVAGLKICPAGPIPPNPSELLASERMTRLLRDMASAFDFVIVDSPPILAVSDAILAARASDGVMLCFRAGTIHREEVRQCRERLRLAGVRILGAVFNRQQATSGRFYRGPHHYYEPYAEPDQGSQADSAA